MTNYEKDLDDIFEAKQVLESVLAETYASAPGSENLSVLTSAILILWRRMRPYVKKMFNDYYDPGLKILDEVEGQSEEVEVTDRYSKSREKVTFRKCLTYDEVTEKSRILMELYVLIKEELGGEHEKENRI